MGFRIYKLTPTDTGRISAQEVAAFAFASDAQVYAKNEAARGKCNYMIVVVNTGAVSIHAPFA